MSKEFASAIYSGAAGIGEAKATIYGIGGGIMALVLCISAVFSIMSTPERSGEIEATVVGTASTCKQLTHSIDGKTKIYPECITSIEYVVNGQVYNSPINTLSKKYNIGDKFVIQYDPTNPLNISYNETPLSTIGWILVSVVIVLILVTLGYNFVIRKYKPLAAYEGATTSIDMARGITRRLFK